MRFAIQNKVTRKPMLLAETKENRIIIPGKDSATTQKIHLK